MHTRRPRLTLMAAGLACSALLGLSACGSDDPAPDAGSTPAGDTADAGASSSPTEAGPVLDINAALKATCAEEIAALVGDKKAEPVTEDWDQCIVYDYTGSGATDWLNAPQVIITPHESNAGFSVYGDPVTDLDVPATLDTEDDEAVELGFDTGTVDGTTGSVSISYNDHDGVDKARGTEVVHKIAEILIANAT